MMFRWNLLLFLQKTQAMLEDFRLKVFITVAKENSFTKAAQALGITQPAVSQNVAELEKGLGVKLFDRLPGEISLTPQGHMLMKYASPLLASARAVDELFDRLPASTVRFSASEEIHTYFTAPALEAFSLIHPDTTFERSIFDDVDLRIGMRPSSSNPFDIDSDIIGKARISTWVPQNNIGGISAAHENILYFDIIFQPSEAFALTKTCRLLKNYLASLL